MDIGAIGSLLGGAGNLLGGIFGKKQSAPDPAYQMAIQRQNEKQAFDQKMAMAKEHGIHPLAMLGVNTAVTSPSFHQGGYDFSKIGYGANQMASAFVRPETAERGVASEQAPAPVEDAIEGQKRRLVDANLRRAEADANLAEIQVYKALEGLRGQPGRPPGAVVSNDVTGMRAQAAAQAGIPLSYFSGKDAPIKIEQDILPPHPGRQGFAAGTQQTWLNLQDEHGQTQVIHPNAIQAEVDKGATLNALARYFGMERAMQITAILENENLILGTGVAAGYLLRHPATRAAKYLYGRIAGSGLPKISRSIPAARGSSGSW